MILKRSWQRKSAKMTRDFITMWCTNYTSTADCIDEQTPLTCFYSADVHGLPFFNQQHLLNVLRPSAACRSGERARLTRILIKECGLSSYEVSLVHYGTELSVDLAVKIEGLLRPYKTLVREKDGCYCFRNKTFVC